MQFNQYNYYYQYFGNNQLIDNADDWEIEF